MFVCLSIRANSLLGQAKLDIAVHHLNGCLMQADSIENPDLKRAKSRRRWRE